MGIKNNLSKLEKIVRKVLLASVVVAIFGASSGWYNEVKLIQNFQNKTNREVRDKYIKNIVNSTVYLTFPGAVMSIISVGYLTMKDIEKQKKKVLNYQI